MINTIEILIMPLSLLVAVILTLWELHKTDSETIAAYEEIWKNKDEKITQLNNELVEKDKFIHKWLDKHMD